MPRDRQIFWAAMLTASVNVGNASWSSATCSMVIPAAMQAATVCTETERGPGRPVPRQAGRAGQCSYRCRAAVEAGAADLACFEQGDLCAKLAGLESGGDPGWPAADNQQAAAIAHRQALEKACGKFPRWRPLGPSIRGRHIHSTWPLAAISADTSQSERNPYSAIGGHGVPPRVDGVECEPPTQLFCHRHR